MKKLFLFVAALCATVALNAAVFEVKSDSPNESDNIRRTIRGDYGTLVDGDTILLVDEAYTENDEILTGVKVVFLAKEGVRPVISLGYPLKITGAGLTAKGITFSGARVRVYGGASGDVTFEDCVFTNSDYGFFDDKVNITHMGKITINNCIFSNLTKYAIYTSEEGSTAPGPADSFTITNCTFFNVATESGYGILIHDHDDDVSTPGPATKIDHCTFYNACLNDETAVKVHKMGPEAEFTNNVVAYSVDASSTRYFFYAYDGAIADHCVYYNAKHAANITETNCIVADPLFVDPATGNLNWIADSPLKGAATDGSNIGDPRWKEAKAEMVFSFLTPAAAGEEAINDYTIKFSAVVPEGNANYAIAYSYDGETWTDIVVETAYTDQTEATFATRGLEEGEVTLRGLLATDKDTVITICPNTLTIVKDTEAPRAIANLFANVDGTTATLTWKNPTHEIPVMGSLLGEENLLELAKPFEPNGDEAILEEENNTLKMTVTTSTAWHPTGVDFDVTSFENVQNVAFKIKGDGLTQIEVMLIQDGSYWWASSAFVPGTDWETHKISEFKHVDWHDQCPYKTLDGNHVTSVAIEVDNDPAVNGVVFYLDSVMVEGTIAPSKYYAKTVIRRSTEDYPETIEDGDAVYEGTEETTTDEIDPTKTYYYTAFAVDDIDNVSAPANVFVEGQQVTHTIFNVTVPAGTDACYLVGSMNSWAVDDPIEMTKVDDTHYTYQAGTDLTGEQYKYVHGDDWAYVEKKADGGEMDNRSVNAAVMNDEVARWADDDPSGFHNAKAAKVCVKTIRNGQFVILKNNVRYNILGAEF